MGEGLAASAETRQKPWLAVVAVTAALGMLCTPASAAEPLPAPPSHEEIEREYFEVLATFDKELPGRGPDVLNLDPRPIPTAFGSILRAEGLRYVATGDRDARRRMRSCGRWLLRNADTNGDGILGWGYPFEFERNGVVAPEHQEYTVVTASMVGALLDWLKLDRGAPRSRIHKIARKALEPFVGKPPIGRTPTGFFAYSYFYADRAYDVYNVGAWMAGQMRRFSNFVRGRRLRHRMRRAATRNIKVLAKARLISPKGNYYWRRTSRPTHRRPNSLGHALITIQGLRRYWEAGGRAGLDGRNRIERDRLYGHVEEFLDGRVVLTTPVWEDPREVAFGSAGVGSVAVLAMNDPRFRHLLGLYMEKLLSYEYAPGRYSTGFTIGPRTTIRGQAGVLGALARYLWNRGPDQILD